MGRKITPDPEVDLRGPLGCGTFCVAVGISAVWIGILLFPWGLFLFVLAIPGVHTLWTGLKTLHLLSAVRSHCRRGLVRGVLVWSDSPNWKSYIEEAWLPRFGDRMAILNWSERRTWPRTLEVEVFERFVGSNENFVPSIVLFRGLRYPLVFRFFYAFRDAKHGKRMALERLEKRLFDELGV